MDLESVKCVSSLEVADVEGIQPHNLALKLQSKLVIQSEDAPATNVNSSLECPKCNISMRPPIYQCERGHTHCDGCKVKIQMGNQCPICLTLEKAWQSREVACKYFPLGCVEMFPHYNKWKHENLCNFRPYRCPYACSECVAVGDIPLLVYHLRDFHEVVIVSGSKFTHRYVLSKPEEVDHAIWKLTVFQCFGKYFCLHFEAFKIGVAPVYIAFLRFMGDESEAKGYGYSLEVGGEKHKIKWEGTPPSIRDDHVKVRNNYDGLIVQRNQALFFSGGDTKRLKLVVNGEIWKKEHPSIIIPL